MMETDDTKIYTEINRRLPSVCERVCEVLSEQSKTDDTRRIVLSFVRRAQCTLLGVNALQQQELWEPAQILVRVLFEGQLTFRQFARRYKEDPRKACERLVDANLIATLKHFDLVSDSVNVGAQVNSMRKAEQVIKERYGEKEFGRIRKHGFTGICVEQRAIKEDQAGIYNLVYRLFSRNVHGTVLAEATSLDADSPLPNQSWALANRNDLMLYIAGISAAGIVDLTNRICGCGVDNEIADISARFDSTKPPIQEEANRVAGD